MLGLVFLEEPIAQLVESKEIIVEGSNASVPPITYNNHAFRLSTDKMVYVYVHTYHGVLHAFTSHRKWSSSFPLSASPLRLQFGNGFTNLAQLYEWQNRGEICFQDVYTIVEVLRKLYPTFIYEPNDYTVNPPDVFCSCGHILKVTSMKAHLKTKSKHANGDEKGKAFLKRVADYVATL